MLDLWKLFSKDVPQNNFSTFYSASSKMIEVKILTDRQTHRKSHKFSDTYLWVRVFLSVKFATSLLALLAGVKPYFILIMPNYGFHPSYSQGYKDYVPTSLIFMPSNANFFSILNPIAPDLSFPLNQKRIFQVIFNLIELTFRCR